MLCIVHHHTTDWVVLQWFLDRVAVAGTSLCAVRGMWMPLLRLICESLVANLGDADLAAAVIGRATLLAGQRACGREFDIRPDVFVYRVIEPGGIGG